MKKGNSPYTAAFTGCSFMMYEMNRLLNNPLYLAYHDKEWGVPVHDDHELFEMLILEGFPRN